MKIVFFLLLFICHHNPIVAAEKLSADLAFEKLKTLQGTWLKKNAKNDDFKVTFELTANNSVLVESWLYQGKTHSLTLYHRNLGELMATHYCPQGNQPRMTLRSDSTKNKVSFSFFDATNLKSIDDSHQHTLGFELMELPKELKRIETYKSKSGLEPSELRLIRKH